MKTAFVHFAEGFEEIEALTIVDVLRRADIPNQMVSITGHRQVTGAHGIKIVTDVVFEDVNYDQASVIILPGGMPGSGNLMKHEGLATVLQTQAHKNEPIAAICAAPMVLGALGILEGKDAVCYPGFEKHLKGATIKQTSTAMSGAILTGRGPGAALHFSLDLVKLLKDSELASKLANDMLVENWK